MVYQRNCSQRPAYHLRFGGTVTAEASETEEETENTIAAVTEMQAGDSTIYVCYPDNNANDTLSVKTTCTAPVFLVFGDTKYDESSAEQYAVSSGLASIAAEEGSSVVVVNPIGDTWSEADAATCGKRQILESV